jgi:hypothetical protein
LPGGHIYADQGSDPLAVTITDTLTGTTITPSGMVDVAAVFSPNPRRRPRPPPT